MKTFGELLSEYIERTGVADAELARTLGVSRQTIFRWREGETQRPRSREDVLHLAAKLRLSSAERDALLLAGGFAPETEPPVSDHPRSEPLLVATQPAGGQEPAPPVSGTPSRRRRPLIVVIVILCAFALLAALTWRQVVTRLGLTSMAHLASDPAPAAPGETLVLVGQFGNYGSQQVGYNVAGRLQEALRDELTVAGLQQVRVETLDEVIPDQPAAERVAHELGAALVVWGEYDSGRVLAVVSGPAVQEETAHPEIRRLVATPGELSATINAALPEEIRWMALYVLGQVHFQAGREAEAGMVFQRALAGPLADERSLAAMQFYLAVIASHQPNPDWSQVIALYAEAIDRRPEIVTAWNNRGSAYLERNAPGDAAQAEADFRKVVAMAPDEAMGYFNLGLALARTNPDDLAPALVSLRTAHDLAPDDPGSNSALCWNLSLDGHPADALPYCDKAVVNDDSGMSFDSRGLAYGLLGRYKEAAGDFTQFLEALEARDPAAYARYAATREPWIAALRQDHNPFDAVTLRQLRRES